MKKIEINDREVFERYHVNSIINSEYQFSAFYTINKITIFNIVFFHCQPL